MAAPLLVELLTEELPPKALPQLEVFADYIAEDLADFRLLESTNVFRRFATPRRLGVCIPAVRDREPDRREVIRGPRTSAFFDGSGKPLPQVATGFARKCGVSVEALLQGLVTLTDDPKGHVVGFTVERKGETLEQLLPMILQRACQKLPVPKMMRWGETEDEFVRPVRGLVVMHGDRAVPVSVLGLHSHCVTRGHRSL